MCVKRNNMERSRNQYGDGRQQQVPFAQLPSNKIVSTAVKKYKRTCILI
jgi:hypothetical protein